MKARDHMASGSSAWRSAQKSFSERYKAAGVDVNAGYRAVELMKQSVASTRIPGGWDLGGLAGCSPLTCPA